MRSPMSILLMAEGEEVLAQHHPSSTSRKPAGSATAEQKWRLHVMCKVLEADPYVLVLASMRRHNMCLRNPPSAEGHCPVVCVELVDDALVLADVGEEVLGAILVARGARRGTWR